MKKNWKIDVAALPERFEAVRQTTEALCEPFEPEDCVVQSMPEASPAKWHLAHTTWFFERFVLQEHFGQPSVDDRYNYLFNSYYNAAGDQWSRPERGLLSRPTVSAIREYRRAVDRRMADLLASDGGRVREAAELVDLGLHHEQQHQELLVTDSKHMFGQNPLHPEVVDGIEAGDEGGEAVGELNWRRYEGGRYAIGYSGDGFCFDNERPRHETLLEAFELAERPVTCGEWLEFIDDGGYRDSQLWLSDGWSAVQEHGWDSPLYWTRRDGAWFVYTLGGLRRVDPAEPVCHISYYEADAFARWAGARLPTEFEWEVASRDLPVEGHFLEPNRRHPRDVDCMSGSPLRGMFGDVWEWTRSDYAAYPGFEPWEGMVGEYNGKFMCNQRVLRGGSCATPASHIRRTYRNFFYPDARWQFAGVRLARDA